MLAFLGQPGRRTVVLDQKRTEESEPDEVTKYSTELCLFEQNGS
jgi:hypothetical protein